MIIWQEKPPIGPRTWTRKLIVKTGRCGSAVRLVQGDSPMADQRNSGKLLKLFLEENTLGEIRSIQVDTEYS